MDRKIAERIDAISSGHSREMLIVLILTLIQGFLWAMMIPVVPLLARDLGATEVQLGSISIVPALTTILFSIVANALGIRFGKRAIFIAGQVTGVICGGLYLMTRSLAVIPLPQIALGVSNMLFWPTELAYLTEIVPSNIRAQVMGYFMAISSVGTILGPSIGGYLLDNVGFSSVFVLYAAVSFIGVLIATTLPKDVGLGKGPVLTTVLDGLRGVGSMLRRPVLRITTATTFLLFINIGTVEYFVPVFLKEAGYSATFIGNTVTVRTTGLTLIRLLIGLFTARFTATTLLFGGVFICVLAAIIIPVLPVSGVVIAANFIGGAAFGLAPILTSTIIAGNTATKERGLGMALDSTSVNSGRVFSGFAIGAVAQMIGFGPGIIVGNLAVLAGLALVTASYARIKRRLSTVDGIPVQAGEFRAGAHDDTY